MTKAARPSIAGLPVHTGVRLVALAHLDEADAARERVAHDRDSEALHDFRVALRRLRSWIRSFRPYFEGGVAKSDRRRLRDIARATSSARDIEVQLTWLDRFEGDPEIDPIREMVRSRISHDLPHARREAIRAVHLFPDVSARLRDRLPAFRDRIDRSAPGRVEATAAAAASRADMLLAELLSQLETVTSTRDGREVHDARIVAKRLRYLFEAFRADAASIGTAIRVLRRVQDDLGDHHDLDVLAATLRSSRPDNGAADPLETAAARVERARDDLFDDRVARWTCRSKNELDPVIRSAIGDLGTAAPAADLEIERKYLLRGVPRRRKGRMTLRIDQGWLPGDRIVERIRRTRSADGTRWSRTLKIGHGLARMEIEEDIDESLFRKLWPLTRGHRLSKRRHVFDDDGRRWEIDEFAELDLVIAEIELEEVDSVVEPPRWLRDYIVREVTGDRRYENRSLAEPAAASAAPSPR